MTGNVAAKVYRCTDASGNVSYSENTCKQANKSSQVKIGDAAESGENNSTAICEQVAKIAKRYYPKMRGKKEITHVYNELGGRDSLSNGAVRVIKYIASFRYNDSISTSRVVELTQKNCQRGGFGKLEDSDMPKWYKINRHYPAATGENLEIMEERVRQQQIRDRAIHDNQQNLIKICQKYNNMLEIYDTRLAKPMDEGARVKLQAEREMTQSIRDENCHND